MVNESERNGIQVAVKNWISGKTDIGKYLFDRCSAYVGGGHPIYVAELLNFACSEIRASKSVEPAQLSHNSESAKCPVECGGCWKVPCTGCGTQSAPVK